MEENKKVINRGVEPTDGRPLLLDITKASRSTHPFISTYREIILEKGETPLVQPSLEDPAAAGNEGEEADALSLADFDDEQ